MRKLTSGTSVSPGKSWSTFRREKPTRRSCASSASMSGVSSANTSKREAAEPMQQRVEQVDADGDADRFDRLQPARRSSGHQHRSEQRDLDRADQNPLERVERRLGEGHQPGGEEQRLHHGLEQPGLRRHERGAEVRIGSLRRLAGRGVARAADRRRGCSPTVREAQPARLQRPRSAGRASAPRDPCATRCPGAPSGCRRRGCRAAPARADARSGSDSEGSSSPRNPASAQATCA